MLNDFLQIGRKVRNVITRWSGRKRDVLSQLERSPWFHWDICIQYLSVSAVIVRNLTGMVVGLGTL